MYLGTRLIIVAASVVAPLLNCAAQAPSRDAAGAPPLGKRRVGIDTSFGDVVARGREAYRKKDFAGAVAAFSAALAMRPDNKNAALLLVGRGSAHEWLGARRRALADYDQAVRLAPDFAEARAFRGAVLARLGESSKAVADLTKAISQRPGDIPAYGSRARAYLDLGQRDRARADFEKVVRAPAKTGVAYENRANANAKLGNYRAAAADFAKAKRLLPGDAGVLNNAAWLRATCPESSVRNGRAAVADATRACELTRFRDATHVDTLAAAYAEIGDFGRAIEFGTQALSLPNSEPEELREHLRLFKERKAVRQEPEV